MAIRMDNPEASREDIVRTGWLLSVALVEALTGYTGPWSEKLEMMRRINAWDVLMGCDPSYDDKEIAAFESMRKQRMETRETQ